MASVAPSPAAVTAQIRGSKHPKSRIGPKTTFAAGLLVAMLSMSAYHDVEWTIFSPKAAGGKGSPAEQQSAQLRQEMQQQLQQQRTAQDAPSASGGAAGQKTQLALLAKQLVALQAAQAAQPAAAAATKAAAAVAAKAAAVAAAKAAAAAAKPATPSGQAGGQASMAKSKVALLKAQLALLAEQMVALQAAKSKAAGTTAAKAAAAVAAKAAAAVAAKAAAAVAAKAAAAVAAKAAAAAAAKAVAAAAAKAAAAAAKPATPSGQAGGQAATGAFATAILMGWQRLDNLPKITSYLQAKPWIKEIIVWNNGRAALPALPAKARVVVPQGNLRDYSKYQACASAKTEFCFYQDDDFTTAKYVDQLWDAAQAHPRVITSSTDTFTWSTNEFWSVFNEQLGLHAQFSWIGCGAVFPRALAVRHLKIMDEFFTESERGIADVAFAWATNAVPVQQLQVVTTELKSAKNAVPFSSQIAVASFHNMRVKTLKLLPRILAKYPMPPTPPTSPCYYVATANSLALCSSVRPYATHAIPFNINDANDLNRRTRMSLYEAESSGHRAHPFLSALDGGDGTWWQSGALPAGAVWGISSPKPRKITVVGSGPEHGWQVSRDGGAAEASEVLWGTVWDVQHNVTFTWAGGEPAVIKVIQVTYAGQPGTTKDQAGVCRGCECAPHPTLSARFYCNQANGHDTVPAGSCCSGCIFDAALGDAGGACYDKVPSR
jgi:hypothetical protein